MFALIKRSFATIAIMSGLSAVLGAGTVANAVAPTRPLAATLREGGFVIVVRHGATFADQADTDPLNFGNIAAQRNLNDKGKALAASFGESLRHARIPIGEVYTSNYNRAYETAILAGYNTVNKTADLTEGGLVVSPNENARRAAAFRAMLTRAPIPGTNTLLITHKPNIVDALGKDWFDVKEGEASIFRPEGGTYRLIARIQMDDWQGVVAAE